MPGISEHKQVNVSAMARETRRNDAGSDESS